MEVHHHYQLSSFIIIVITCLYFSLKTAHIPYTVIAETFLNNRVHIYPLFVCLAQRAV